MAKDNTLVYVGLGALAFFLWKRSQPVNLAIAQSDTEVSPSVLVPPPIVVNGVKYSDTPVSRPWVDGKMPPILMLPPSKEPGPPQGIIDTGGDSYKRRKPPMSIDLYSRNAVFNGPDEGEGEAYFLYNRPRILGHSSRLRLRRTR